MTKIILTCLSILAIIITAMIIFNNRTPKLRGLDLGDQVFIPCDSSVFSAPHCIASDGSGYDGDMKLFPYVDTLPLMIKRLDKAIEQTALKRHEKQKLVYEDSTARHYVFTTQIMRYKDDLLFVFDYANKVLHYRSSSRIGYDDFNQNKERMNEILFSLAQ